MHMEMNGKQSGLLLQKRDHSKIRLLFINQASNQPTYVVVMQWNFKGHSILHTKMPELATNHTSMITSANERASIQTNLLFNDQGIITIVKCLLCSRIYCLNKLPDESIKLFIFRCLQRLDILAVDCYRELTVRTKLLQ